MSMFSNRIYTYFCTLQSYLLKSKKKKKLIGLIKYILSTYIITFMWINLIK